MADVVSPRAWSVVVTYPIGHQPGLKTFSISRPDGTKPGGKQSVSGNMSIASCINIPFATELYSAGSYVKWVEHDAGGVKMAVSGTTVDGDGQTKLVIDAIC